MSEPLKIVVVGATGKMGQAISHQVYNESSLELLAAIDIESSGGIGKDVGELIGLNTGIKISVDFESTLKKADVVIDFTRPEASLSFIDLCAKNNVAYVLGTTGFSEQEKKLITDVAKKIPICFSPNMSIGVNLLISLTEKATKILQHDYDIEIIESHHKHKVDAPSGTSLRLGESVAKVTGRTLNENGVFKRHGNNLERKENEIGFSTIRGGDIVGEHTVMFAGIGERIELTHKASSRSTFSKGAIIAAKFLRDKKNGLFDMFDVLGLKDWNLTKFKLKKIL